MAVVKSNDPVSANGMEVRLPRAVVLGPARFKPDDSVVLRRTLSQECEKVTLIASNPCENGEMLAGALREANYLIFAAAGDVSIQLGALAKAREITGELRHLRIILLYLDPNNRNWIGFRRRIELVIFRSALQHAEVGKKYLSELSPSTAYAVSIQEAARRIGEEIGKFEQL